MQDDRAHILATEDDPAIRGLLSDLLEGEGFRVSFSTAEVVADVAGVSPDLILLDWWDSGTGVGGEVLERLKADPRTAGIPVVLLTGAVQEVAELAPDFAGIGVTIVLKPFDIDDLLAEIRRRLA